MKQGKAACGRVRARVVVCGSAQNTRAAFSVIDSATIEQKANSLFGAYETHLCAPRASGDVPHTASPRLFV